jgi:hypothetical protein
MENIIRTLGTASKDLLEEGNISFDEVYKLLP